MWFLTEYCKKRLKGNKKNYPRIMKNRISPKKRAAVKRHYGFVKIVNIYFFHHASKNKLNSINIKINSELFI